MKWYKYDIRDLSDTKYQKWYSLMSEDKRCRVDRFRFVDDKKRTVAGEMLARKAISEWCGVVPESIILGRKERGKPYAKDLPVEFSISHSGNVVVCAIDDKPIGIDIEYIRPIDLTVAKRICTDEELLYLFGYAPHELDFICTDNVEILTRFYELWTAKEAYSKCLGNEICFIDAQSIEYSTLLFENSYVIAIYEEKEHSDDKDL